MAQLRGSSLEKRFNKLAALTLQCQHGRHCKPCAVVSSRPHLSDGCQRHISLRA